MSRILGIMAGLMNLAGCAGNQPKPSPSSSEQDRFHVDWGESYEVHPLNGFDSWGTVREGMFDRGCRIREAIDVDKDGKVDIIVWQGDWKTPWRTPKIAVKPYLMGGGSVYQDPATPEELAFVQERFDKGMRLARQRFGELQKVLKAGSHKGSVAHFKVHVVSGPQTSLMGSFVGSQTDFCKRARQGGHVHGVGFEFPALSLEISEPQSLAKIQPELDKLFLKQCDENK